MEENYNVISIDLIESLLKILATKKVDSCQNMKKKYFHLNSLNERKFQIDKLMLR